MVRLGAESYAGAPQKEKGSWMSVEVRIPTILRPYTGGEKLVTAQRPYFCSGATPETGEPPVDFAAAIECRLVVVHKSPLKGRTLIKCRPDVTSEARPERDPCSAVNHARETRGWAFFLLESPGIR